ncbi:MAG: hypothetical protein ACOY93_04900 [Bacillota bacterium]
MRFRLILPLLMLLVLLAPASARALSCIHPTEVYDSMDVVVRATVTARPSKNQITLTVDRYYKGTGPILLHAAIRGFDPDDQWMNEPQVGRSYLIGFRQEEGGLVNQPCDIFMEGPDDRLPADLRAKMGVGTLPNPSIPPSTPPEAGGGTNWSRPLLLGAAGVLLAAGAVWLLTVRRRSAR